MPGLRGDDDILKAFEGLDRVPGSKQLRRSSTPESEKIKKKIFDELPEWDANPIMKVLGGVEREVFTISALAEALGKKIVTIRLWERKGYIPIAPYRLRAKSLNGKKVDGNRVYSRPLIEIAIEEFKARGLLGSARVEWSQLGDLTDALVRRWRIVVADESRKASE